MFISEKYNVDSSGFGKGMECWNFLPSKDDYQLVCAVVLVNQVCLKFLHRLPLSE